MNINHRSDRGIFVDLCCGITNLILNKNPIITYHPNAVLIKKKYPSENINRKGEGGLRTKGYFKKYIKDNPLISVITVVFNGENDLEQTIKSVINQTYNNIEYIVIDGGSTDDTLSIIKKYEDKINYWVSEDDNGIYDAMNKGVGLAQGEWLCFINSGDIFISQNTLFDLAYALKDGSKLFIYSNGTVSNRTGTYNTISDAKLKENIVDATSKLDKLMAVKVRNYNLIGDELKQIGFVAQELETIFPSLIDNVPDLDENKEPTGEVTKGVKLTVMIPILVKAIQELKAEFDAYKAIHP